MYKDSGYAGARLLGLSGFGQLSRRIDYTGSPEVGTSELGVWPPDAREMSVQ